MTCSSFFRRAASAAALLCVVWLGLPLNLVAATSGRKNFDIPTGEAPATLRQFIAQADVQLMYVADEVQGVATRAVKGSFTPGEAIGLLLAETGLAIQETKNGAIAITRTAVPN